MSLRLTRVKFGSGPSNLWRVASISGVDWRHIFHNLGSPFIVSQQTNDGLGALVLTIIACDVIYRAGIYTRVLATTVA